MYVIEWALLHKHRLRSTTAAVDSAGRPVSSRSHVVSRTVWILGLTSLLTDVSSEMVASVLPAYLVLYLGLSPLAFGFIDGLYQGLAALLRLAAGTVADRLQRHKEVAVAGYAASAACRLLILAAGSAWTTIAGVVALDRLGKGIRTAPRDALIAHSTNEESLATAFGVHRSMDAVGAMLGPIVAFALLLAVPNRFDLLFIASFGFAILGVGAIVLLLPPSARQPRVDQPRTSLRALFATLAEPRFKALVIAGSALGLATISDSFIFLMLQRRLGMAATAFPLFYVATSFFTALFAWVFGRAADRIGRKPVMIGGYVSLASLYALLLAFPSSGLTLTVVMLILLGAYYAATDGVVTALAAAVLPSHHQGSGLAALASATNVARLLASVAFGWMWTIFGTQPAVAVSLAALSISIVATAWLMRHQ
jgi:MFS family permease